MSTSSPPSESPSAESQWIFTLDELSRTPSGLDGMPLEKERENRGKGFHFVTQVGIMLKLPQMTLSTAGLYMHRFFMRHSMVNKDGRPGFHYYVSCHPALYALQELRFVANMLVLTVHCSHGIVPRHQGGGEHPQDEGSGRVVLPGGPEESGSCR